MRNRHVLGTHDDVRPPFQQILQRRRHAAVVRDHIDVTAEERHNAHNRIRNDPEFDCVEIGFSPMISVESRHAVVPANPAFLKDIGPAGYGFNYLSGLIKCGRTEDSREVVTDPVGKIDNRAGKDQPEGRFIQGIRGNQVEKCAIVIEFRMIFHALNVPDSRGSRQNGSIVKEDAFAEAECPSFSVR
jgi:hypothetical protein